MLKPLCRISPSRFRGLGSEKITLKGFKQIKAFVAGEFAFWEKMKNRPEFANIHHNHFANIENNLRQLESRVPQLDNRQFKQESEKILSDLRHSEISIRGQVWRLVYSKTPQAEFLSDQVKSNPEIAQAAYHFLVKNPAKFSVDHRNLVTLSMNCVNGYLKAFEFENAGRPSTQRANQERHTLEKIRSEWLQKTEDMDKQFTECAFRVETWREETSQSLRQFREDKETKLSDLEAIYQEKLKLQGPVQHWKERAKRYNKEGWTWLIGLGLVIGVTVAILLVLLYKPPESFSLGVLKGEPLAVKAIVLVGAALSLCAYLTKTFTRLTFSSFHLSRDAQEREQLTMVYLALVHEQGEANPEERKLILQSLFSRSDTGLLGKDSSPSMPGVPQSSWEAGKMNISSKPIVQRQR